MVEERDGIVVGIKSTKYVYVVTEVHHTRVVEGLGKVVRRPPQVGLRRVNVGVTDCVAVGVPAKRIEEITHVEDSVPVNGDGVRGNDSPGAYDNRGGYGCRRVAGGGCDAWSGRDGRGEGGIGRAIVQQHRHVATGTVGRHDVAAAASVEVTHCHPGGGPTHGYDIGRAKIARTVACQHRYVVSVYNRQVQRVITIEVTHRHR